MWIPWPSLHNRVIGAGEANIHPKNSSIFFPLFSVGIVIKDFQKKKIHFLGEFIVSLQNSIILDSHLLLQYPGNAAAQFHHMLTAT